MTGDEKWIFLQEHKAIQTIVSKEDFYIHSYLNCVGVVHSELLPDNVMITAATTNY